MGITVLLLVLVDYLLHGVAALILPSPVQVSSDTVLELPSVRLVIFPEPGKWKRFVGIVGIRPEILLPLVSDAQPDDDVAAGMHTLGQTLYL